MTKILIFERFDTEEHKDQLSENEVWDSFELNIPKPNGITDAGDLVYNIKNDVLPRFGTLWIPHISDDTKHVELDFELPTVYNKFFQPGLINAEDFDKEMKTQYDSKPQTIHIEFKEQKILLVCDKIIMDPLYNDNLGYYYIYKISKFIIRGANKHAIDTNTNL